MRSGWGKLIGKAKQTTGVEHFFTGIARQGTDQGSLPDEVESLEIPNDLEEAFSKRRSSKDYFLGLK